MRVTAMLDGRPIQGGAVNLGGAQNYDVTRLLAPDGRDPSVADNGIDKQSYGTPWITRRTQEIIALFDHPLHSFFSGVEALTNETMRTTTAVGLDAVSELYTTTTGTPARGRFWAPMPATMYDEQRLKSAGRTLPDEGVGGRFRHQAKRMAVPATTGPGAFPVVGRIASSRDDPYRSDESEASQGDVAKNVREGQAAAAARRVDTSQSRASASALRSGAGSVVLDINDPNETAPGDLDGAVIVGDLAAISSHPLAVPALAAVPSDPADAAAGKVQTPASDPTKNVVDSGGKVYFDTENGEAALLRRLNGGQPLTESDLRAWLILYAKGAGVTQPAPRVDDAQLDATRRAQRAQIDQFIMSAPADFHWRVLPEHLRVLFLTPRARAALEHAAWFAEFHQPSDPNLPAALQIPNSVFSSDRQRVPLIDLITHKHVRVPFQTLVARIILYWKHLRLANASQADADLVAINQVMMTLRTMREESNGFVSLMGHYDLEAQKSRFDTAEARVAELSRTGRYHSDMDREFYSGAVRPGSNVARLMASSAQSMPSGSLTLAQDAAIANAMRAAPRGAGYYDVARDARARYAMTSMIFSGLNK